MKPGKHKKENDENGSILEEVSKASEEAVQDAEVAEDENVPDAEDAAQNSIEAELMAERDRCLRIAAEYDNYRKRSAKERENIYADVRADTVTRFLPVYDNLQRAAGQESADEAYRKGIEMILTQFEETLEKLGVKAIPAATGEKFDPNLHEAVMHGEDPDKGEGEIAEEFQRGFTLGDKVIRHSMVKVVN